MDADTSPYSDVYSAGQAAVKLLKMLLADASPRSDTPKIEAEIERLEMVFGRLIEDEDLSR